MTKKVTPGAFFFWIMVIGLYLPIALLVLFSFNDNQVMTFPLRGFTTEWYSEAFSQRELMGSLWNSIWVGGLAAAIATMLGTAAAIALMRMDFPGRGMLLTLASLPLVIPYIVMGVALLVFFRQALDIQLSLGTLLVGHVVINIPIALLIVAARLAGFAQNLEEAAMDLGATYWETLWRVTLPICGPAIAAAFLTCFTTSFEEYAMSVFLVGTETTLPIYIYAQLRYPRQLPVIVALSSVVMIGTILVLGFAEWLRRVGEPGHAHREAAPPLPTSAVAGPLASD